MVVSRSAIKNNCNRCDKMATKSCSRCKVMFYCSVEHKTNAPPPPKEALKPTMDLLNPKLGAVPTPISRAQLYKTNPDLRQLRDKVDDCIELVNDGNDALYSSPATAENKLRDATNLASSLLTSIDRHKVVMSLFFDITHTLTHALTSLGSLKEMTGSAREALVMYQTALPQCEAHEDHSTAFTCRVGIGNCYKAMGQLQKAIDVLTLELEFARLQKDEIGEAIVCCSLSKCYSSLPFNREAFGQNIEKALAFAERDVVLSAEHSSDYPAQLGAAHCQLASCLKKGGDYGNAKEFFDSAVQLLQEGDDRPSTLMALIEYTRMLLTEGGGQELPPLGARTLELAYSLATRTMQEAETLKDKDNALLAMCLAHRSSLASQETKSEFFKRLGVDKGTLCSVCNTAIDYDDPVTNNDIFTTMKSCKHTFHKQCFADWVAKDNLRCPMDGCTVGSDLLKHFKEDPSIVLRLAKGELNVMNYF